jgi:hypothetical protein
MPVVGVEQLLKHHTGEELARFYEEHRALLERSVILMVLPRRVEADHYNLPHNLVKEVYSLGERQYLFLSERDRRELARLPEKEELRFTRQHKGCLFRIMPVTTVGQHKRKLETHNEVVLVREANTELRIRLALEKREREVERDNYEREMETLRERYDNEKKLMQANLTIEFQERELSRLLTMPSPQQSIIPVARPPTIKNRTLTMKDWLGPNLYNQDYVHTLQPHRTQRWQNLFTNPALTPELLRTHMFVARITNYKLRLVLPLTYRYNLATIIRLVAAESNQSRASHVESLLEACPKDYSVVLYGGMATTDLEHRINCSTIAVHCHLVRWAQEIRRRSADEMWSLTVNQAEQPAHCVPSLELLEEFFPSSVYYTAGSYLTHNMTMPLLYGGEKSAEKTGKKKKSVKKAVPEVKKVKTGKESGGGLGTGHGKKCPYCTKWTRTLVQGSNYQLSHHPTHCPAIALLSANEAVVLETLRQRCQPSTTTNSAGGLPRKKENKFVSHSFVMGGESKARKGAGAAHEFSFDSKSLLRHATPEELDAGEHINGLRVNRRRMRELRRTVQETLRTQLDGPIFDAVDTATESFVGCLYDMEVLPTTHKLPAVRSLLYDEFGQKFLESRFEKTTKKALHGFDAEEALFFSLDTSKNPSPRLLRYMDYYGSQLTAQQFFLLSTQPFVFEGMPTMDGYNYPCETS